MTDDESPQTTEGPGEPDREGVEVEGDGPQVHTKPGEGHPAGEGGRGDRDIGGPTADEDASEEVEGGGTGASPGSGFDSHGDADSDEDISAADED